MEIIWSVYNENGIFFRNLWCYILRASEDLGLAHRAWALVHHLGHVLDQFYRYLLTLAHETFYNFPFLQNFPTSCQQLSGKTGSSVHGVILRKKLEKELLFDHDLNVLAVISRKQTAQFSHQDFPRFKGPQLGDFLSLLQRASCNECELIHRRGLKEAEDLRFEFG